MLEVENLTVRYKDRTVVDGVSFTAKEGEWLMIVGPNGAGKSTVLKAITRGVDYGGRVLFDGVDIRRKKPSELARDMGVLMQQNAVAYSFSVEEIVEMGRYSYSGGFLGKKARHGKAAAQAGMVISDESARKFSRESGDLEDFHGKKTRQGKTDAQSGMVASDESARAVEDALELTGMTAQRKQSVLTLSGGELQRTFLAQVFAQNPRVLLLDEPTNHLDLIYQKQIFQLIEDWLGQPGRAVVSVVHDLSLAKAYGDKVLLMNHGRAVAQGSPDEVLVPRLLDPVYQMDVYGWMRQMLAQWG